MRDFCYSSKKQPCPVCGHTSGCKLFSSGIVFCMRVFSGADITSPDYRFIRTLNGSYGSIVAPDRGFEPQFPRYRAYSCAGVPDRVESGSLPLSSENFSEWIHLLKSLYRLTPDDRSYIQGRGLSDEMIRDFYFSLPAKAAVEDFPPNFPGMGRSGKRLSNAQRGIAGIATDPDGKAIGIQYRLHRIDSGKYRWLSNEYNTAKIGGEMPLTYINPKHKHRGDVAIVEGILFKPHLAAEMLGCVAIGAAGGLHQSSPRLFHSYWQRAGATRAVIYPDAGDLLNPMTVRRLHRQLDFLSGFTKVSIAYWPGQNHKFGSDIDELTSPDEVRYLNPIDFFLTAIKDLDNP